MARVRLAGNAAYGIYVEGSSSNSEFAYQGMIGFNFNVDSNFVIDVGYRYFGSGTPKNVFNERFHTHLVNLGITYNVPA